VQPPQDDDTADLLAPVPAVRTGSLVGYARVSTKGQLLDRQIHALNTAGCIRIFSDKKSGKNAEREELWKALDYLREGDTLVVPSLDRLGRSIQDLIAIVSGLRKRGVGFTSLHEPPRKILGWKTPAEIFEKQLRSLQQAGCIDQLNSPNTPVTNSAARKGSWECGNPWAVSDPVTIAPPRKAGSPS
jgi:hypothetical protein